MIIFCPGRLRFRTQHGQRRYVLTTEKNGAPGFEAGSTPGTLGAKKDDGGIAEDAGLDAVGSSGPAEMKEVVASIDVIDMSGAEDVRRDVAGPSARDAKLAAAEPEPDDDGPSELLREFAEFVHLHLFADREAPFERWEQRRGLLERPARRRHALHHIGRPARVSFCFFFVSVQVYC